MNSSSTTAELPLVGIVVANRNGAEFLRRNLPSVGMTNYPNFEAVVVDNASTDESVELVRREFEFCQVIVGKEDRGFAGNVNRGLSWGLNLGAKYIAVITNDVRMPAGWLDCAVKAMEQNPNVGVLGFIETKDEHRLNIPRKLIVEQTAYPCGCAFVLRSEMLRKVGFYDETLYMYGEEQDYYPRVIKAGFILAKINVTLLHEMHGLAHISHKQMWLRYRNAIYCALKNFGAASGAIVAFKIFCLALLPEMLLKPMRSHRLSRSACSATLSDYSGESVDTRRALRAGSWPIRLGVFTWALGWNIWNLPKTLKLFRQWGLCTCVQTSK